MLFVMISHVKWNGMFLCDAGPSVPPEPEGTSAEAQAEEPRRETEVIWEAYIQSWTLVSIENHQSSMMYCHGSGLLTLTFFFCLHRLSRSQWIPLKLLRLPPKRLKPTRGRARPAPSVSSPGPQPVTTAWLLCAVVTCLATSAFPAGWRAEEINVHRWVSLSLNEH